jgi:hypothetical protein
MIWIKRTTLAHLFEAKKDLEDLNSHNCACTKFQDFIGLRFYWTWWNTWIYILDSLMTIYIILLHFEYYYHCLLLIVFVLRVLFLIYPSSLSAKLS